MEDFALWIEATPLSKALFDITWLWPLCESVHFLGLAVLIGGAGFLDLRLLGIFRGIPIRDVKSFMPFAIGGFGSFDGSVGSFSRLLFCVTHCSQADMR